MTGAAVSWERLSSRDPLPILAKEKIVKVLRIWTHYE
jgi:hypothetical protein